MNEAPAWLFSRQLELVEIARAVGATRLGEASYITMATSGLIVERHHDSIRVWHPKSGWPTRAEAAADFGRITDFCGPGSPSAEDSATHWIHTFRPVLRRCIRCGGWENGPHAGHTDKNGCRELPRAWTIDGAGSAG